jgi:predicted protein tyrosine phosphatase/predicted phosphohydrolase
VIPDRCPSCNLFWTRGDSSLPLRVVGIWERERDAVTRLKCPRCGVEQIAKVTARESAHVLRGSVLERTLAGDVPYPASVHHVCGLPGLHRAPLAAATRIVSILDPSEPQPVELVGHEAKTLTLRFDDVVARGGFVAPEREHVAALLEFDRGAREEDSLVVHCHAGLSRSTAAFVALLAQRRPAAAAAAFAELRAVRPRSWPNYRMIAFADDLLDTGGALSRELLDHRKIMVERYSDLLVNAKANGHDGVWDTERESRRATLGSYGLRLVIASDTHEQHAQLAVPEGDVFIHCGDITYNGDLRAIADFGAWLAALPHQHKLVIAGNHDFAFEHVPAPARKALGSDKNGVRYLQDSGVTISGVCFWGSPWQPWFFDWAFNLRRGPALAAKWQLIPERTDVLITHGPPMGILDDVRGDHVGCGDLLTRVAAVKPRVHAFGHIHEGSGIFVQDGTTYVNASICDEQYRPGNPIRVVDI